MRFLLFTLYAPMGSFGEIAVGERRMSWARPGRSAILGLVAAAQGVERTDETAHQRLEAGLYYAVRTDAPGRPLLDYHTAQTPKARKGRTFATRQEELNRTISIPCFPPGSGARTHASPLPCGHAQARPSTSTRSPATYGTRVSYSMLGASRRRSACRSTQQLLKPTRSWLLCGPAAESRRTTPSATRSHRRRGAWCDRVRSRRAGGAGQHPRRTPARYGGQPNTLAVRGSAGTDRLSGRRRGMTPPVYLSRARLKRDASVNALAPLLLGKIGRGGPTQQPGHHLVWSLFADGPDRRRDFLWREMDAGVFLVLSSRQPEDRHGLFEIAEPQLFTPALESGDRLGFSLRANPVIRRRDPSRRHSVKHDVVMDALRPRPKGDRSDHRRAAVHEQGLAWLERQGESAGFTFDPQCVRVDGYEQLRVSRKGSAALSFSTLDFEGLLTVSDPGAFLPGIIRGFGAAKAYGCGLMLIRRA